jgi:PBP1b-binding outer membrane lipoprotein LpoB
MKTIIAIVFTALVALSGCSGLDPSPTSSPTTTTQSKQTAKPKPKMTKSQEQAVGAAKSYLKGQHFSKKGLIHQLKFDGYSTKDATFAVEYIHPDWNQQAAGSAKDYLAGQHFSHSGLVHQLEFDGYTHSQAEYGTKKAGL